MPAGPSSRAERTAFIVLSALTLAYVALRAVKVPVVHDESMTFFLYVEPGKFLPFLSHWDAGNHLLSTALGWLSYTVFGQHPWALRLPNVLAFVLYAGYGWKWAMRLSVPLVRWCFLPAWLLMPFLLDFFSLFRGYGLAMAFWAMALYELCGLLERWSMQRLSALLVAMACATYCALSLLPLWAVVLGITALLGMHQRQRGKSLLLWLVLGAAPLLLAAAYTRALSLGGALYYGVDGILSGTLPSLLNTMLGISTSLLVGLLVVLFLLGAGVAGASLRRRERSFQAWAMAASAGFLLFDVAVREALYLWNGTPFPEDRTALHWAVLFLLLVAFALDRLARYKPRVAWAALLLLVLPVRTLATLNFATTVYWPEQAIPDKIFLTVDSLQRNSSRKLTIGAYHQMPACWGFGMRERGLALNALDVSQYPHGGEDLLLIDPHRDTVPDGYREVAFASSGYLTLYARNSTSTSTLLLDSVLRPVQGEAEFRELWHPPISSVQGKAFLVKLDLSLIPEKEPITGDLAVVTDAPGAGQHNDHVLIQFMRSPARSDSLHTLRHIPAVPLDATRTVVFLWNPAHLPYTSSGRMRIYLVDEKNTNAHP